MSYERRLVLACASIAVLLATLAIGCSEGGGPSDTFPPRAGVSFPRDGQTWVPPNTTIEASFSERLDSQTVNQTTFHVQNAAGHPVHGTVAYHETLGDIFTHASFIPSRSLAPSTRHIATVTTGIRDRAGNYLPSPLTWTFTTGPKGVGTWQRTSVKGAPPALPFPKAVWTGSELLVWSSDCACGGRYDPVLDMWRPMASTGGPKSEYGQGAGQSAVWTGSQMIVWGGAKPSSDYGWRYDPVLDTWSSISTANAPEVRSGHVAVWTGSEMLIWGGDAGGVYLNSGGRYNPATDSWIPMATVGSPEGRGAPSAIWTGSEMIVWGGLNPYPLDTGGRYNPTTNTWTPTTVVGAPISRYLHSAVWTGDEMIVWGGLGPPAQNSGDPIDQNSGGRYDPGLDRWLPTALSNVPIARWNHKAIWTGDEMIIWGGYASGEPDWGFPIYGGRYQPATDTWSATTYENAPVGRYDHAQVWTGSEMIVWGGNNGTSVNTGGRYVP